MTAPRKNALEWTVFGVSAALIVALCGTLVYFEAMQPDSPPDLHVQVLEGRERAGGYVVTLKVENRGARRPRPYGSRRCSPVEGRRSEAN